MIKRLSKRSQIDGDKDRTTETGTAIVITKEAEMFEELVRDATGGDHDAILILCQEIARSVLFHARCILRNYDDAGDVAQEVLIRVCAKIRDLKDPKAFRVWLNSIITNETNRYMAKNSKYSTVLNISDYLDAVEEDNEEFLPQEHVIREEARMAVIDAIDTLPGRQREAVVLHYYEGLSVTETATVMEISQPRVSECLTLAREKVRHELEKQDRGKIVGSMYGVAAGPMGAYMSEALHQEAELFEPVKIDWIQQTILQCGEFLQNFVPEAAAGAASWLLALKAAIATPAAAAAGVTAAAVTVTAVTVGIYTTDLNTAPEETLLPDAPIMAIEVAGRVVFSGGDGKYAHINPGKAVPELSSSYGDIETLSWQIMAPGGKAAIYSGTGGVVEAALVEMRERGMDGYYEISFLLQDAQEGTYTLKSNFLIQTGKDSDTH